MKAKTIQNLTCAAMAAIAVLTAGCGKYVRDQGRAAAQPVIMSLKAAPGVAPEQLHGTLLSDVVTNVNRTVNGQQLQVPTVFNDVGEVTMALVLKDPGQLGIVASPSLLNQVTFTRYHVSYRRSDGRNTPGVDVPYAFDGAATFTVPPNESVSFGFEIVRHAAKEEAPLLALRTANTVITTIADVTFYGRDQAGNDVSTTGSIQIDFGNFGDPS